MMTDFNAEFENQLAKPMSPLPNAHEIAVEVVRRDQRRTRLLAVLCLILWILGAAGMALLVTGLNQFVMGVRLSSFRRAMPPAEQREVAGGQSKAIAGGESLPDDRAAYWDDGTGLLHHSLPLIDGALVALLLAAFSTVLLIFSSRRTTLNRNNISLAQISEQLMQMGRDSSTGATQGSSTA